MTTANKNRCYFQSGGPTQVINSTFVGLYSEFSGDPNHGKLYVSRYGVNGLIKGKLENILPGKDKEYRHLLSTPGAEFGSARIKLSNDFDSPVRQAIAKNLAKYKIGYLFVNGGNDSRESAALIQERVKAKNRNVHVIGLPKTIDNDLYGTDHCPGYGSAAKYVANSVIAIAKDDLSYEKGRINIVETRGRDSGFLAASAILAKKKGLAPDFIYVPETHFDIQAFLDKAISCYEKKKHCLIVVSEGIRNKDNELIVSQKQKDSFGNIQIGGVANYLASLVAEKGFKTRGIELSLLNRASTFLPSLQDIQESGACGGNAYHRALEGLSGVMVTIQRSPSLPYNSGIDAVPLSEVIGKIKQLPLSYITESKDNIKDSFIDYVAPLITGRFNPLDDDGLLNVE